MSFAVASEDLLEPGALCTGGLPTTGCTLLLLILSTFRLDGTASGSPKSISTMAQLLGGDWYTASDWSTGMAKSDENDNCCRTLSELICSIRLSRFSWLSGSTGSFCLILLFLKLFIPSMMMFFFFFRVELLDLDLFSSMFGEDLGVEALSGLRSNSPTLFIWCRILSFGTERFRAGTAGCGGLWRVLSLDLRKNDVVPLFPELRS